MEDDWEKIADDPKVSKIPTDVNKWAGEDEEDPKDSWEDALEDEKKDEEKADAPVKPKKTAQQRIADKERAKRELAEKLRKEKEQEDEANLTPEEKLRRKLQEEEEYTRAALDTLGLTTNSTSVDSFNPKTKEEFTEFSDMLCKKFSQLKTRDEYVPFLDEFVRNLLAGLSSTNIRKIKNSIDNLYLEKQKMEKGDNKKKKTGAGKVRTKLRVEVDDDYASRATLGSGAYEDDDYDDFM